MTIEDIDMTTATQLRRIENIERLPDGVYEFKYWVDGNWCLDEDPNASDAAAFLTSSVMVKSECSTEWAYVGS